ncbi:hypothetical protein, partial [Bacillus subtilis]
MAHREEIRMTCLRHMGNHPMTKPIAYRCYHTFLALAYDGDKSSEFPLGVPPSSSDGPTMRP